MRTEAETELDTRLAAELIFRTFMGKFVCGLCALCGVFILTLPIPIVVSSFAMCYKVMMTMIMMMMMMMQM